MSVRFFFFPDGANREKPSQALQPSVSVFGLQHDKHHHGRDKTYRGHDKGEDDVRRRIPKRLGGTLLEKGGVEFHEHVLHQPVGPRERQALRNVLRTHGELVIGAARELKLEGAHFKPDVVTNFSQLT